MIRRKYMRTRQLKPGMILDHPIEDETGRVLVARGAELDEYIINSLLNLGIMSVYIQEGESDSEIEKRSFVSTEAARKIKKLQTADIAKVTLKEGVRERVAEGIENIYNSETPQEIVEDTEAVISDLVQAMDENDAIAFDVSALRTNDEYTFKHSVDVSLLAMIIAKELGMSKECVREVGTAGLLHDIGKTRIPSEIINKPSSLNEAEFLVVRQHSLYGYHIVKACEHFSEEICQAILQHHEKLDGCGYPLGIKQAKISLYARILAVADIYDALITERPYKSAYSQRDAIEIIMSMTTEELDLEVVQAFLDCVIVYPVGSVVSLSNGELAKVVRNVPHYTLRPVVVSLSSGAVYDLSEDVNCTDIIIL